MDAKEYLERINKNERVIANKQIEKQYWLGMATGISVNMGGERVQTSSSKHPMENQVIEVVAIDEEIEKLKGEIADIIATLEMLKTEDYDFLHKVYVRHIPLKEVQEIYKKSYSWVTTTHNRALGKLQKVLDAKGAGFN